MTLQVIADISAGGYTLIGVVVGGTITTLVPAGVDWLRSRKRAHQAVQQALYLVYQRLKKIDHAVQAVGGGDFAQRQLNRTIRDETRLSPAAKTLRNEVTLLGSDLDGVERAVATYPRRHRSGERHELNSIIDPCQSILILHEVDRIDEVLARLKRRVD
jgi:hypothetical protein